MFLIYFPVYKFLKNLDFKTKHQIGMLLAENGYGPGDWRQVANKFGMDQLKIRHLENYLEAGEKTLEYIQASYPDLTAYDFCKTLKEHDLRRLDIVRELQGHLSVASS